MEYSSSSEQREITPSTFFEVKKEPEGNRIIYHFPRFKNWSAFLDADPRYKGLATMSKEEQDAFFEMKKQECYDETKKSSEAFQRAFEDQVENVWQGKYGIGALVFDDSTRTFVRVIEFNGEKDERTHKHDTWHSVTKASLLDKEERYGWIVNFFPTGYRDDTIVSQDALLSHEIFQTYKELGNKHYGEDFIYTGNIYDHDPSVYYHRVPDSGLMNEITFTAEVQQDAEKEREKFSEYLQLIKRLIANGSFGYTEGEQNKINILKMVKALPSWFLEQWNEPVADYGLSLE